MYLIDPYRFCFDEQRLTRPTSDGEHDMTGRIAPQQFVLKSSWGLGFGFGLGLISILALVSVVVKEPNLGKRREK